ncbi:MAG: hypothetical protein J2P51_05790 [Hyphomicrobiaceae bacterium]|nr:hypothetical protein [Hyphomicrobiaceae bacterium]
MLEVLILAAVAAAGYADAPWWAVLFGAGAVTVGAWWRKVQLLRQHPRVPFSTKMIAYLVVSIVINLGFAFASYLAGRLLRGWLGG